MMAKGTLVGFSSLWDRANGNKNCLAHRVIMDLFVHCDPLLPLDHNPIFRAPVMLLQTHCFSGLTSISFS